MSEQLNFPERPANRTYPLRPVSPEHSQAVYIEDYLTSPEGHKDMEDLIDALDGGLSSSDGLAGRIQAILENERNPKLMNFTKLLANQAGVEQLNAPKYAQAFHENQAMSICRHLIERARYDGAVDSEQLYRTTLAILANITRYQVLDESYDPDSEEWQRRARRLLYLRAGGHTQFLPRHMENPTYSREY